MQTVHVRIGPLCEGSMMSSPRLSWSKKMHKCEPLISGWKYLRTPLRSHVGASCDWHVGSNRGVSIDVAAEIR
jgi:hypothetical protein